jgi:hypothetical protein
MTQINLMTFIGLYFLFYNLFNFFIIAAYHTIKTNKNMTSGGQV